MRRLVIGLLACGVAAAVAGGEPAGTVRLPLAEYLELREDVRRASEAREAAAAALEEPVAEVVSQRREVRIGDGVAEIEQVAEIEVLGRPETALVLPVTGVPWSLESSPSGTAFRASSDGLHIAPPGDGRHRVTVRSHARLEDGGGVRRLWLAAEPAAVATTMVELDAELGWSCPGAVVASETVEGGRRRLELALPRGAAHVLEIRRQVDGGAAERTLAQSVVVTLVSVGEDGPRRHDVVLYEVSRGGLDLLEIGLPDGVAPERLATDEGEAPLRPADGRIVVSRGRRLTGTGWLAVTSRIDGGGEVPLEPVVPAVTPRARYLAVATPTPARVSPSPEASWQRVDLGDLPAELAGAAGALGVVAAWRHTGADGADRLSIAELPEEEPLEAVVERRTTTTLLTQEGTLLHRDRLVVRGSAAALAVRLPVGATLWSTSVDGLAVRPVERDGRSLVPLPFGGPGVAREIEVVSVAERALDPGRTRFALTLPEVEPPVRRHEWRLLLPEDRRYRYRTGDVLPAPVTGPAWSEPTVTEAAVGRTLVNRGTASIRGTVTDNEGVALPGVTVELSNLDQRWSRNLVTGLSGGYEFAGMAPGSYEIQFELAGFGPVANRFRTSGGEELRLDATMVPEAFASEIEVTAEAPMVDTTRTSAGQVFTPPSGRSSSGRSRPKRAEEPEVQVVGSGRADLADLRQGLVGGVRPLPVTIPETGKLLRLTAVLPPSSVTVVLQAKGR